MVKRVKSHTIISIHMAAFEDLKLIYMSFACRRNDCGGG